MWKRRNATGDLGALAATVLVVIWLLATVAAHLPGPLSRVRRLDRFALLPAWSFFAPNPGISDSVLLVRDRLDDERWTPWRVAWRERPNRFWWAWRPGKRVAKLVSDAASGYRSDLTRDAQAAPLGPAFLLLARIAERAPHDFRALAFQFAIVDISRWWSAHPVAIGAVFSPAIVCPASRRARRRRSP